VLEGQQPIRYGMDYFLPRSARIPLAYTLGSTGSRGFSDDRSFLSYRSALFVDGRDPVSKERLFGRTNEEGNHGYDLSPPRKITTTSTPFPDVRLRPPPPHAPTKLPPGRAYPRCLNRGELPSQRFFRPGDGVFRG